MPLVRISPNNHRFLHQSMALTIRITIMRLGFSLEIPETSIWYLLLCVLELSTYARLSRLLFSGIIKCHASAFNFVQNHKEVNACATVLAAGAISPSSLNKTNVLKWILKISSRIFCEDTQTLAESLLWRTLKATRQQTHKDLQLLTLVSLFIATKLEDGDAPGQATDRNMGETCLEQVYNRGKSQEMNFPF